MRRTKVLVVGMVLIAFATVMCGEAMAKKVSLRYFMWDPGIQPLEEKLIAIYEKENPDVHVAIESAPFAQYWDKMLVLAAARNLPDVFCMSSAYIKDWGLRRMLENLQPYVDRDIDPKDYYTRVFNVVRYPDTRGDMYAFPYAWVVCISYYNKDMFDKAGLSYPRAGWGYEDLLSYAQKLTRDTDGDGKVDRWGYYVYGRYAQFDPFVFGNRGQPVSEDFKSLLSTSPRASEQPSSWWTW